MIDFEKRERRRVFEEEILPKIEKCLDYYGLLTLEEMISIELTSLAEDRSLRLYTEDALVRSSQITRIKMDEFDSTSPKYYFLMKYFSKGFEDILKKRQQTKPLTEEEATKIKQVYARERNKIEILNKLQK